MSLLYRPLAQTTIDDPYPIYDRMRNEAPVFWHDQTNAWVISSYDDCRFVLSSHDLFASDRRRVGMRLTPSQDNMQVQDPPIHTKFRIQLSHAFKGQDLDLLASAARARLADGLRQRAHQAQFNFMSEFATDVALNISLELLGVHEDKPSDYHSIFEDIAWQMDSTIDPSRSGGEAATARLRSLMEAWMAEPRCSGLIGALQSGPLRDFDRDFVVNTMCGLFNACYSTLYATTGSVITTILTNRDIMNAPGLVATDLAAQEMLRYISPAQGAMRFAVTPTTIRDKVIARGDAVIVLFGAANRDPTSVLI